jgi:hypothetical protein
MAAKVVNVYTLSCGCGHNVSALDAERAKAAMLEHIGFAHHG